MISDALAHTLKTFRQGRQRMVVLTGAGVSAESGIPTFRGSDGFWRIGSRVYQPQEIATMETFREYPEKVWQWYLYRLGLCRDAAPNAGHRAIAAMENTLIDRFTLITQNVDGLHLLAGNTQARTLQIHGNLSFMRCARECTPSVRPLPLDGGPRDRDTPLSESEAEQLHCPSCGGWARPHVLWFDEIYNEHYYRAESALGAADRASLLLVVGTSGATNLPNRIVYQVARRGGTIVEVNIDPSPFSRLVTNSPGGAFIQAPSGEVLPEMAAILTGG
jgi:NAD-dependent deacetylase